MIDLFFKVAFVFILIIFIVVMHRSLSRRTPEPITKTVIIKKTNSAPIAPVVIPSSYYSKLDGFRGENAGKTVVGDKQFREVALTFDIGNFSAGEKILNILKKTGVKATMFLANNQSYKVEIINGKNRFIRTLEATPSFKKFHQLIKRMDDEGHEVGNHTWSHHNWVVGIDVGRKKIVVSKEHLTRQLNKVNAVFKKITGHNLAPIWRSPFGACSKKISKWAEDAGYHHIYWTRGLDSLDWTNPFSSVATLDSLKKNVRPGGIFLFHLGNALRTNKDKIYHILEQLIVWLRQNNYQLVKVSQIVDHKRNQNTARRFVLQQPSAKKNKPHKKSQPQPPNFSFN